MSITAWKSVGEALELFLSSPAAGRPEGEGSLFDAGDESGWTNERVVEAVCGARGIDARDPALYDAVRSATERDVATFREAFCAVALAKKGRRDWLDFDLRALQDCHPAFATLALPEVAQGERRDFEDTILAKKGAMFSSKTIEWRTPADMLDRVRRVGPIALDPCAHPRGLVRAAVEWTGKAGNKDGLAEPWKADGLVYCNPPFGRTIVEWASKCALAQIEDGADVVALLPARTDTIWWHDAVTMCSLICFLKGRLKFLSDDGETDPAPFPSAVCLWSAKPGVQANFRSAFADAGWVVQP